METEGRIQGGQPDLVIFEVLQRDFIEPFELLQEIALQEEKDICSIQPGIPGLAIGLSLQQVVAMDPNQTV